MLRNEHLEAESALQPAPRGIRPSAMVCSLFRGFLSQFGWAFFGFGMIFFWVFAYDGLVAMTRFQGPLQTGQAVIRKVEGTNASINKRRVMAYHYDFSHQGRTIQGVSYATGFLQDVGAVAPVEFVPAEPAWSRLTQSGYRASTFDATAGFFVLIFPLVGLGILSAGLLRGRRTLSLLRHGSLTRGRLTARRPTGGSVTINGRRYPVYELTFSYKVDGQYFTTRIRTHDTERLEDEATERLVYLPARPMVAVPLDAVPGGGLVLDREGLLQSANPGRSLVWLLLPVLVLLLHGTIAALVL